MELLLAENHSAMTHLPIATAILAAAAAITFCCVRRKEISLFWAALSLVAFLSVLPTITTGIFAAKGRLNERAKPYIQSGIIVRNLPENTRIFRHQIVGMAGACISALVAILAVMKLRGRDPNPYMLAVLTLLVAVLWGVGGHLGGKVLWGPDTFPGLETTVGSYEMTEKFITVAAAARAQGPVSHAGNKTHREPLQ